MTKIQETSKGVDRPVQKKVIVPPPPSPIKKSPSGDGLLTLILIALGTLGLYHVGSTYEQPSVYNTNISPSSHYNNFNYSTVTPTKVSSQKDTDTHKTYLNQLIISGKPQVDSKLAFTIDSYDNSVSYLIDLGNGDFIEPREKTVYYEYPVSGSYLVEMVATYKGQESVLYSDFIDVYNSVELVSSVH